MSSVPIELINISCFDQNFDSFWNRIKDKYYFLTYRDSAYMNWRYAHVPTRKYDITLARGENRILGYLISRTASVLSYNSGIIMDFLFESSPVGWEAGHSLVQKVLEKFEREQVHLVCCHSFRHTQEYHLLKNYGFLVCPGAFKPHPFHLVIQVHDHNMNDQYLYDLNHWYWSMGDYDVL